MEATLKLKPAITFEENFTTIKSNENNASLYIKNIIPSNKTDIRNHIILLHGVNDHSGYYAAFIDNIKYNMGSNTMITTFDLVGHGKSSGTRSYISSFSSYCKDLLAVLNNSKEFKSPSTKNFIIAPCLGGLITLKTLLDHATDLPFKIHGTVLSNPMIKPNFFLPKWSRDYISRLNSSIMKFRVPLLTEASSFYSDYCSISEFEQDLLVSKFYTLSMMNEVAKASHQIRSLSFYLDTPSLFLISENNKITDTDFVKTFIDGMSTNVQLELFKFSKHNILNGTERDMAQDKVIKWILNL